MAVVDVNQQGIAARPWTARAVLYGGFVFACLILLHPTVIDMMRLWAGSSSWHHGFLVAPLAFWMIYDRHQSAPAPSTWGSAIGLVLFAAGIWLYGNIAGYALLEHLAFVSLLISGACVVFGPTVMRYFAVPAAFLFFMAPFGEVIVPALQIISAAGADILLNISGFEAIRQGVIIETTADKYKVAEACAGLNLLLASILTSTFLSYCWFRDRQTTLFFIVGAALFALAMNILRVFIVIALATIVTRGWDVAGDHQTIGLILYAIMVASLIFVGRKIADSRSVTEAA